MAPIRLRIEIQHPSLPDQCLSAQYEINKLAWNSNTLNECLSHLSSLVLDKITQAEHEKTLLKGWTEADEELYQILKRAQKNDRRPVRD